MRSNFENSDDLMHGFCQGREEAFNEIFRELYPALCFYGFKITGNQAVAEDIAQESFIKVWHRRPECTHFLSLKSYLYTTVKNACIDWARKNQSQEKAVNALLPLLQQTGQPALERLVMTETCRQLHLAINELPARCQKIVRLSYLEGKSIKQIAVELNIETGSVGSHKTRGIMLLRKRLRYFLHLCI